MTRILLAVLEFYRRWLSPAVHSLGPGGCRYRAHVLGIRHRRNCNARPSARIGAGNLAPVALPSLQPRGARSGSAGLCRTSHAPRTITIERAAPCWCAAPQRQEVTFARNS